MWNTHGLKIWPVLIWTVQPVSRHIFWEDHESVNKNAWFNLWHLLCPKLWWGHQEQVGWPPLIWRVQLASELKFWRDFGSEEGNLIVLLQLPIWINQWCVSEEVWVDLLCLGWFNLCLNPFCKEILNLDRNCWWLLWILCNSLNDPGYRGEGQVTSSKWDDLYVNWTCFQKILWIWRQNLYIWPITFVTAVSIAIVIFVLDCNTKY